MAERRLAPTVPGMSAPFTVKPSDVIRVSTDSSGRGIFMTVLMSQWWDGVCEELGFVPVITQGAWMVRNGGGAAASAGYHDGGGCGDLRVWNLTDAQVVQVIRTLRRHGAAAWLRNVEHGGFTDPHIHFVLGSDYGLSAGAKAQWAAYVAGRDGLASNGRDYHWRPSPLVLKPPRKSTIKATMGKLNEAIKQAKADRLPDLADRLKAVRKAEWRRARKDS